MFLKASSFNTSSTSADDGGFRNSMSLLDTTAPTFSKFSVVDSTCLEQLVQIVPCATPWAESNIFLQSLDPLFLMQ